MVATLGLGIGANAGLFELVDRLYLRPPAYLAGAESVHRVYFTQRSRSKVVTGSAFGYPIYRDLRAATSTMATVAAHFPAELVGGSARSAAASPCRW
ncbi:MAG TPA: hypothetical protein VE173_00305 [Longimicrobiales bacterium]|nr:hypothetical protein [Longimicrobiales bacterium]